jgi:hypothetical protein
MISKVNTFAQILLAGSVLGVLGLGIDVPGLIQLGSFVVGALTVVSGSFYLRDWLAYVANLTRSGGRSEVRSGKAPQRPRQLVFDLPVRAAVGRQDFFVSTANEAAVDRIDRWPDWPASTLFLVGPPGSGKSHLAQVWCGASGAALLDAGELRTETVPTRLREGRWRSKTRPAKRSTNGPSFIS